MTRPAILARPGLRARLLVAAALLLAGPVTVLAGEVIPVPAVTIYPGDIIRDTMLTDHELQSDFAGSGAAIHDRTALVGKTARRTLLPGLPIANNAVGEPKVVTIGAMVRVVFNEGGLTITTYGSALQAGAVGDVIPVRNTESGLTVSGTVARDGSILVSG